MPEQYETRPSRYRQSVAFVYVREDDGSLSENGTGFFVCVPGNLPGSVFVYFVTARHVILGSNGQISTDFKIRVNKGGSSAFLEWSFTEGDIGILTHPDETVDIAVIPFGFDMNGLEANPFMDSMFVSKEMVINGNIIEGESVFFPAMFTSFPGENRIYPILRFGRLAMIPGERIPWKGMTGRREMIDAHLVEVQSFGGNSGAPVFIHRGPIQQTRNGLVFKEDVLFLGLLKGTLTEGQIVKGMAGANDSDDEAEDYQSEADKESESGKKRLVQAFIDRSLGIAAVIPAFRLREILYSRDMIESRKAAGTNTFSPLPEGNELPERAESDSPPAV